MYKILYRSSDLVFVNKTRNIYETSLDTYELLRDKITKTYKEEINNELKRVANKFLIGNRTERMNKREASISL